MQLRYYDDAEIETSNGSFNFITLSTVQMYN